MLEQVHWLGHAAFRLDLRLVVYIDPYQLTGGPTADVILLTHRHADHCSPPDIAQVHGARTLIVGPPDCLAGLPGPTRAIAPGESLHLGTVEISAVPAYNVDKTYHPKSNGWVGYRVAVDGTSLYHAGDTDYIPEMEHLRADIALLPIGGTYTMTADDAARAVQAIRPAVAIPMHFGTLVGTSDDAERFRTQVSGATRVVIMATEQPPDGASSRHTL